jgi:hypothetical protein
MSDAAWTRLSLGTSPVRLASSNDDLPYVPGADAVGVHDRWQRRAGGRTATPGLAGRGGVELPARVAQRTEDEEPACVRKKIIKIMMPNGPGFPRPPPVSSAGRSPCWGTPGRRDRTLDPLRGHR